MLLKQEFESKFCVTRAQEIIWGDMDAFQHINNTVYFRYFENVRIAYFDKTGINQFMQETKNGPILGETSCKYLAPLVFPDRIICGTNVTQIRDKRFTMVYEIFSEKLSKVVAVGSGEIVFFDYNKNTTCMIPEEIVNNMKQVSLE